MNKGDVRQGRLANGEAFRWSGRLDLNQRPPAPHAGALPSCATPRHGTMIAHGGYGGQGWAGKRAAIDDRCIGAAQRPHLGGCAVAR